MKIKTLGKRRMVRGRILNWKKKNLGFTIVELMVVMMISMLIISGVSLSIRNYVSREKVNQAAASLMASLNLARNAAIVNETISGFTSGLDYVAVTISASGKISAYPVNNVSGLGSTYFSTEISNEDVSVTQIAIGGLQFGAGSGKLLGKNAGSYQSYPLPSGQTMAITVSSADTTITKTISITPFGISSN